jgi:two-component system chemotaxis response regulator CheB
MVSAFTRNGAQVTLDALEAGAFDFIAKPSGGSEAENLGSLRDELLAKVRAYAISRRSSAHGATAAVAPRAPTVRRAPGTGVRAVVIGASTGGPRALAALMPELCQKIDVPILIVQHMPAGFTRSLAESLARQTGRNIVEATEGMKLQPSCGYVAPGGKHLLVRGPSSSPLIGLNEQPPENRCRPSADVLFRTAAATFGAEVVAVILTGMGQDGTAGLGAIRRAGGYVIAQDEESSIVWGMPRSAVEAGVVDEVRPLNRIAAAVACVVHGKSPT